MKYLIPLLFLFTASSFATDLSSEEAKPVCEITSDIPRTMHSTSVFQDIGTQFLKCIGNEKSVTIHFVKHDMYNRLKKDKRMHRETTTINWLREAPTKKDKLAGRTKKIPLGISYHYSNVNESIVKCLEPTNGIQLETLGHEVLHTIIGDFHR